MFGSDASATPAGDGAGPAGVGPFAAGHAPDGPGPLAEALHRVANTLAVLSATLRMERRRVGDPAARAALEGAVARIEATAQVQRLIHGLPPGARLDLTGFLGHLAPVVGRSLGMGCGVRGTPVEVSARTAEGLAVATVELALNACKHGHDGAPGRGVEVRVGLSPGGWARLSVRDWGRGLREAASPFRGAEGTDDGRAAEGGLGLRLVASTVEALGGRMTTLSDGGAHVVLEVPRG